MPSIRNGQKVGVLFAGLGSVSSTLVAGVEAIKKGLSAPIGSQALCGYLGEDENARKIQDVLPLVHLEDIVFGGWDIFPDNGYESAQKAKVLEPHLLEQLKAPLEAIRPYPAAFDASSVKPLKGTHIKECLSKRGCLQELRKDIRDFKKTYGVARVVVVICNSTEATHEGVLSRTMEEFEEALSREASWISPSVLYATAAIEEGAACVNATPSVGFEVPALMSRAKALGVPLTGKDLKTGQTLLKTMLAPGLKVRMLGLAGWYSTNILGNRDGQVLDDPASNQTKVASKQSVLSTILNDKLYPNLYGHYNHQVHIDYYPPRGDNKEAWDNIDIFGWLGYPMQIKVNFLCRDSILAAPLLLDLILFSDLAKKMGRGGVQTWLSLYHKSPAHENAAKKRHDLFLQYEDFQKQLGKLVAEHDNVGKPSVGRKRLARPTSARARVG